MVILIQIESIFGVQTNDSGNPKCLYFHDLLLCQFHKFPLSIFYLSLSHANFSGTLEQWLFLCSTNLLPKNLHYKGFSYEFEGFLNPVVGSITTQFTLNHTEMAARRLDVD